MTKIALLIDSDNVSYKHIPAILEGLNKSGDIIIKRIYGDFSLQAKAPWLEVSKKYALKQVHQYNFSIGKNATDMVLVIDAMKLMYENDVDTFAIATNDSDFTALVETLREAGKQVIVYGTNQISFSIQNAASSFIPLIQEGESEEFRLALSKKTDKVYNLIEAFLKENNSKCCISRIKSYVLTQVKDFSEQNYGYSSFGKFLNDLGFETNGNNCLLKTKKIVNTSKEAVPDKENLSQKEIKNTSSILLDNKQLKKLIKGIYKEKKQLSPNNLNKALKEKDVKLKDYGFSSLKKFVESLPYLRMTDTGKNVKLIA